MHQVTLYENTWGKPIADIPLSEIVGQMQSGADLGPVIALREHLAHGRIQEYKTGKTSLRAFTISGTFKGNPKGRSKYAPPTTAHLNEYNGLIGLDYDNIGLDALYKCQELAQSNEHVVLGFRSPSGGGYKLFVLTDNTDPANHKTSYAQVKAHFDRLVGEKADQACSNITRLCYLSIWDEYANYKSENTRPFPVKIDEGEQTTLGFTSRKPSQGAQNGCHALPVSEWARSYIESPKGGSHSYTEGSAHKYLTAWAVAVVKGALVHDQAAAQAEAECYAATFAPHTEEAVRALKWAFDNVKEKGVLSHYQGHTTKTTSKPSPEAQAVICMEAGGYDFEANPKAYVEEYARLLAEDGHGYTEAVAFASDNFVHGALEEAAVAAIVWQAFKEAQKKREVLIPKPYEATKGEETDWSVPKLLPEEAEGLDAKTRNKMWHYSRLESELGTFWEFRINSLKGREEYRRKGTPSQFKQLTEREYNQLARSLRTRGVVASVAAIKETILSHFSKEVHPVRNMLELWTMRMPSKDVDYIEQLANCVQTDEQKLWRGVWRRWMVAAVANCYVDRQCTNHTMPVLVSAQGRGKTRFITSLFPAEYRYTGALDFRNKDTQIMLSDTFIISVEEQLHTLTKEEDWERLKDLVTAPTVNVRRHYAKTAELAPRIANFIGAVNRGDILRDETGNRRFFPFNVIQAIKLPSSDLVRNAWGQAYQLFKNGWNYLPSKTEQGTLETYREQFKALSDVHHYLLDMFEPWRKGEDEEAVLEKMTALEVSKDLKRAGLVGEDATVNSVGKALAFLGFVQKNVAKTKGGKRRRRWLVKRSTEL